MEVFVVTVKKVLILARSIGTSESLFFNRTDSEYSTAVMARDVDAVAEGIEKSGFEAVVYAPKSAESTEFYTYYGKFVKKAKVLLDENALRDALPEVCAAILLGVPAKAGTLHAFMDGTYSSDWLDYYIDGRRCGEIAVYNAVLNCNGVSVVEVIGDKAVCDEAKEEIGDITTVVTKTAESRFFAKAVAAPDILRKTMTDATENALKNIPETDKPRRNYEVEIEFMREDYLEDFLFMKNVTGFRRVGARRLKKIVDKPYSFKEFFGVL